MIDLPKNVDNMASVAIVKLCSPLSHFVISLGRRPIASANCFLDRPRSSISKWIRFDISNESFVASRSSFGISANNF